MSERDRVVVVGGGVVGLSSAARLLEAGMVVRILRSRASLTSTSAVAPALFTPYPGAAEERLMPWVRESLRSLGEIERTHSDAGVHTGPIRLYQYSAREGMEGPWDALMGRREVPAPPGVRRVEETRRPHMDMTRYLPWLERRVLDLGGVIETREVLSLEEELRGGARAVVNCSGLGSRLLARDQAMKPLRGLVARVPNIIGVERSVHDDAPGGHVTYVFVYADHLAVGSTFEPDQWDETADPEGVDAMFERARNLLRLEGVARWRELSSEGAVLRVGLRPARVATGTYENVRLELEQTAGGPIVHNYGHGRSGVTLSWGCAAEVVEIVRSVDQGDRPPVR